MGETAKLAERVAGTAYEDVPEDAIERAEVAARDVLGLSLHGSGTRSRRPFGRTWTRSEPPVTPRSSAAGRPTRRVWRSRTGPSRTCSTTATRSSPS